MLHLRLRIVACAIVLCGDLCVRLSGQMQPVARRDGELLPIVTYNDRFMMVLQNGKKRETHDMDYHVRPAKTFGGGFIEIAAVKADLDPLLNASLKERTQPSAIRFRYSANLIADRSLSDCFALLTFTMQGSVGTHIIPIGRLSAGKSKEVKVALRSQVDSVGSLHVFANGTEVCTSQKPEAYDVHAYYDDLIKNVQSLSAAELLKLEDVYDHELSANGRYVASIRRRDAKKVLIVYDLDSMKLLCETSVGETDDIVRDLTWTSDHEVAYVAQDDYRKSGSDFNLHLLDSRTGQTKKVLADVRAIINPLPDDPEVLVLLQQRPIRFESWSIKYNLRDGKSYDLKELAHGYSYFDRNGNDRIVINYQGSTTKYSFRPTPESRWRDLDDLVKQPGLHFNLRSSQLLERVVDLHSIGPDGDTLYVSTRLDGADRFQLAAFSLSEGVIKKTIAKHPKYDLTTNDGGLARLLFAKDSPQLIGMIYEAQKPQVVWLDEHFAAVQQGMDSTFPDHVNLPIDWSKDGSTFVYFSASDQDPGTYYVSRPYESRLIPLLELGARFKGRPLARTTPIEFTSRDGQKIPAYLTRPSNAGEEPTPLIVDIHGGPMARDSWRFSASNQFFASRGYTILQVNYRGSSGYGAAYQKAGLLARLDTVVLDDIADGVRHLIDQKQVDPARVAVMGGSFGGWATYLSLAKYPEMYHAGIAIAAIANWRKTLRHDRWQFENRHAYTFWKTLLERGNFAEDEEHIDPFLRSSEIKQPVFIIHGEGDNIVSATEARLMLNALKKHNPNVQARLFPYAAHTYWPFADRVVQLNEIAAFLDRHLAKPASPVAAVPPEL